MFKRIMAVITIQCFLVSGVGFASPEVAAKRDTQIETSALAIDSLAIPRDFGTVKERCPGSGDGMVMYIQDAHCNYEAQTNIAKILEYLIKEYNVNFVAVEGADGIVDTSWFKAFPDNDIKQEVADYFMKKGEITGAEFLSITSDYPFTIYGAEDRKYYVENLNSFLESYPHRDEFMQYYANIKGALNNLKKYIYSGELNSLDENINKHHDKEMKFADYVRYLADTSKKYGVNTADYKNFSILLNALKYEKDIDFDVVNDERAVLIDELSKKLPKDNLSELVSRSLSFKLGKIDGNTFYQYLAKLANENEIDIPKKYKNLEKYIMYTEIYSQIDNERLFDEIELIVDAIKAKMFKNDDQRELDKLWKDVTIIIGFMKIELTNKEYEYYQAHKASFRPDDFVAFINNQSARYGLSYNMEVPDEGLTRVFGRLIDFYEIALKRDKILVDNMFKGMDGKKTDVGVLITGGFHTKGITKFLKEKNTSYVVIAPSITEDVESPYISVLTGQKTPFEELLSRAETAELGTPLVTDAHILDGLKALARGTSAETSVNNILNGRRVFFEEYAVLYTIAYLGTKPGALKDNVVQYFTTQMGAQASSPNARTVKEMLEREDIYRYAFEAVQRAETRGGTAAEVVENYIGILPAPEAARQADHLGTYPGLALTVTGEPLDPMLEREIHDTIRKFFNAGNTLDSRYDVPAVAEVVRKADGTALSGVIPVDVYVIEGLRAYDDVLIAHLGYGGDAAGHAKRQIYMSPRRWQEIHKLSEEEQKIFWKHELGHLSAANRQMSEIDFQRQQMEE
ncbi:MAG: hypothetical protein ABH885_01540, partial [Candidatus Omnitrophota bacterium]